MDFLPFDTITSQKEKTRSEIILHISDIVITSYYDNTKFSIYNTMVWYIDNMHFSITWLVWTLDDTWHPVFLYLTSQNLVLNCTCKNQTCMYIKFNADTLITHRIGNLTSQSIPHDHQSMQQRFIVCWQHKYCSLEVYWQKIFHLNFHGYMTSLKYFYLEQNTTSNNHACSCYHGGALDHNKN